MFPVSKLTSSIGTIVNIALTVNTNESHSMEADEDVIASLLQVDNEIFSSCSIHGLHNASKPNLACTKPDEDIMASLLQVDNGITHYRSKDLQVTPALSSTKNDDDIRAFPYQEGYHIYLPLHEKSLATTPTNVNDSKRVSMFGLSHFTTSETNIKDVNDEFMSSLIQVDKCKPEKSAATSFAKICTFESSVIKSNFEENHTRSDKVNLQKKELLNDGALVADQVEISSVGVRFIPSSDNKCVDGFYGFLHQCYDNLFQRKNSVDSLAKKSNAFIEKDQSFSSALSIHSQASVNLTTRRRIFVRKEIHAAAAWAKRFEDPRSGLRDSLHRVRVNYTDKVSQKLRSKTSKQRLIAVS
jgi:hypothetical protein